MMLSRLLWKFLCVPRSIGYKSTSDFANVKPCDNKAKVVCCLKVKFADSIATNTNAVQ